jgi:hypothetical protein
MPGPSAVPIVLSDEEREVLAGWARRRKTADVKFQSVIAPPVHGSAPTIPPA